MVTAQIPIQQSLGLKGTTSKKAMISCIQESLLALERANRNYDLASRHVAIVEYNFNFRRTLQSGVKLIDINERCRKLYFQCMAATLQGIAIATIMGDYYHRVDILIEWYEQDRERMIKSGFLGEAIDSRMTKLKFKLTYK